MNNIEKKNNNLPTKLEDLTKFILVGREQLTAVRACIRAIDKVGVAQEVREQKLEEGQLLGEALLDAEVRIGELLKDLPSPTGSKIGRGVIKTLPEGITHKQSHYFQQLADNPVLVEQVKAEAREAEDIATRSAVLSKIKDSKREEKKEEYYKKVEEKKNGIHSPVVKELPNLILADPPWKYDFQKSKSREIENHYDTCTVEEMVNHIPPHKEDCVLFMWATAPKLLEALELIKLWGFTYKTHAVWDKQIIGTGYWFRGQHELLIVATKGNSSPPIDSLVCSSVFSEKRTTHSKKPACVYEWIEKAFALHTKLEMYCRSPRTGWQVFGNEVSNA